jgi:predicted ATPase
VLTRLEISGFKSFQDFALDLEPLLMVLGPNSAGKSNLFDALALISRLSEMGIARALQGGRGSIRDQFSHTSEGIAEGMSLGVELLLSDTDAPGSLAHTRFRYELSVSRKILASGIEELNIIHEALHPILHANDTWISNHPEFAKFARYDASNTLLALGRDLHLSVKLLEDDVDVMPEDLRVLQSPRGAITRDTGGANGAIGGTMLRSIPPVSDKTLLAEVGSAIGPHISAVAKELRSWRFLHLGMVALRESSERAASTRLASDGSNLPTALAALPKPVGARVQADLAELIPGLKSVQVTTTSDEFGVEATFSDGQRYPQRVLSDGTLRLLALLTLLHSAEPGVLVAYEEPENGLFPGRLRELMRRMRVLVQRTDTLPVQVLLNGHSPAIIAALYDLPGSLAFADLVRRKDGIRRTRVRAMASDGQDHDPATLISRRQVEALLDAARPEIAE